MVSIETACDAVDTCRLTGGLVSCNPHAVEHVKLRSPVGNPNINRKITGATVGH